MSWNKLMELDGKYQAARDTERKAFERYLAAFEIRHQAHKENQPDSVITFVYRMEEQAYQAHQEAMSASKAVFEEMTKSVATDEQPSHVESPAAISTTGSKTKTAQLQAALDEASKTCLPLQGAKVTYQRGQGFYVRYGNQTLAYLQNFKRGMGWLKECQQTGRPVYSDLRLR